MEATGAERRSDCLIGIDLGTATIKVAAFGTDGRLLALERAVTPTRHSRPGWVEHDPAALWEVTAGLLRAVVASIGPTVTPLAVAPTSVGEAGLPIDRRRQALGPLIAWNDGRSAAQAEWWSREVGLDEVHRISGQAVDPHYGVNKLLWLREHEPERFGRTAAWLSMADWILLELSGEVVTDPTLASRTMVFDQARLAWSTVLIDAAGLSTALFPPVVPCGTRVGGVTASAARATGLPVGTAVVTAGHDRLCGSFVTRSGSSAPVDSTGSAEAVVLPSAGYVPRTAAEAGYVANYADVVPGQYIHSARIGYAGSLVDWFRRLVSSGSPDGEMGVSYADLVAEVRRPLRFSGLLVFPSFGRVVTPFWERHNAPGLIAGLQLSHTRGDVVQALLEGVTYSLRANLEWLRALEPESANSLPLLVEGGATRNEVWMQLKADITGRPVEGVTLDEPAALGAALQAGIGAGVFADHAEAGGAVDRPRRTWVPEPDRAAVYDGVFRQAYLGVATTVAGLNRVLLDASETVVSEH